MERGRWRERERMRGRQRKKKGDDSDRRAGITKDENKKILRPQQT